MDSLIAITGVIMNHDDAYTSTSTSWLGGRGCACTTSLLWVRWTDAMKRQLPPPGFICYSNLCRSLLLSLFHSLCQWFFFTQVPEKFSLLLPRDVFTLTFQKSFHSLSYVFRRHAPICPSLKVFVGGTIQTLQGTKTSSTRSRIPAVSTLIAFFHWNQ